VFLTAVPPGAIYIATDMVSPASFSNPVGEIAAMSRVAEMIREGAEAFLSVQYHRIFLTSIVTTVLLFFIYIFRDPPALSSLGRGTVAVAVVISFLLGAACSSAAGYCGLSLAVHGNLKVALAAAEESNPLVGNTDRGSKSSLGQALLCGYSIAAMVVGLAVLGISSLYLFLQVCLVGVDEGPRQVPMLLVGFGFGASFVALFAQLGGGIFTKAADVGADLAGKIDAQIPEDDPRNPAVIADLVGDNVGDCAGRGADLFESISGEMIAAMILGGRMSESAGLGNVGMVNYILFPLVVHALSLVAAGIGTIVAAQSSGTSGAPPLAVMRRGLYAALLFLAVAFGFVCWWLLHTDKAPKAWWHFMFCGYYGMAAALISALITEYYTDSVHPPVQGIVEAARSGHATGIIAGFALGMESTALPTLSASIALVGAYWTGGESGLAGGGEGLFGIAVATMGMLSVAAYVLTMDFFGPIADNAGGIIEMTDEGAWVGSRGSLEGARRVSDILDAAGNTTKAVTKGYAMASAYLACFLLFSAFMTEIASFSGESFTTVDFAKPEVFVGGAVGAMLVFYFASLTLTAVGETAADVVQEVRRQYTQNPGILTGSQQADYAACVELITESALSRMMAPGLLAVLAPVVIGLLFRLCGAIGSDDLLGAKAVTGFLMVATITGVMLGTTLNNSGGAWDNAKKLVEERDGKNTDLHRAVVTGDTVGDPFKDTAGPSIHVLIKLISTVSLVLVPLFCN